LSDRKSGLNVRLGCQLSYELIQFVSQDVNKLLNWDKISSVLPFIHQTY